MIRRLFTIAAVISLLTGCGIGWLWVRSHLTNGMVFVVLHGRDFPKTAMWYLVASDGHLSLGRTSDNEGRTSRLFQWQFWRPANGGEAAFGVDFMEAPDGRRVWSIWGPFSFLFAIAAGFPAVWFGRYVVARKRPNTSGPTNRCLACGYDLRESADLCPECGIPISVRENA